MTPERWQQIDRLFEAALELEPGDRTALLEQKCAGDQELRREVESLLAAHKQSASFIEEPPSAAAAELLGNDPSESLVGQQIGRYKVLELLGAGGMGEVYLAEDTRLGRKVALKLLPSHFAQDKDRLRRFEREAHAASALNHPNILTIHEVEQVDGQPFIVTEFVDGVTLRERMAKGRMKLGEVLDITVQVAGALSAAHGAGIVHRDIKPENMMLRRDGYVKVLDFGIAKLIERPTTGVVVDLAAATGPTVKTDTGVVMGTATYMSPEQARGLAVDERTDIWSLGVVLYEMLTVRAPFEGGTVSDVIVSILEREPLPLIHHLPEAPAELQRIITKALRKTKEERYQTVRDMALDLKHVGKLDSRSEAAALASDLRSVGEVADERATRNAHVQTVRTILTVQYLISAIKRHRRGALIALVTLVTVAAGIALILYKFTGRDRQSIKPAVPLQAMKIARLTTIGRVIFAAISPDGKYVAYTTRDDQNSILRQSLWVRQVATGSEAQIISPSEFWFTGLNFSRDGNYIYYVKWERGNGMVYQKPVLGGTERKLRDVRDVPGSYTTGLVLSPDGNRLAFVREHPDGESVLTVANAFNDGGEQRLVTRKRPDVISFPTWSPDGKMIACVIRSAESGGDDVVKLIQVADGAEMTLPSHKWKHVRQGAWLPDGSGLVLPVSDQVYESYQLWHVSYPSGEVRRITNDPNNYYGVSLTADSTALVTIQSNSTTHVWVVPNGETSRARQINLDAGKFNDYWGFAWTPDGKIVYESQASGNQDLWVMDQDGSHQKQLTVDAGGNFDPLVTPGGEYIVFASTRSGKTNIWRMDSDSGNPKQLTNGVQDFVPSCSPDGQWVVYTSGEPARCTLWKVAIAGGAPVQLTDYVAQWPSVSPDGKLIACWYYDEQANLTKLAVIPFEGGRPIKTFDIGPTVDTWAEVRWTVDGRALTYSNGRDILSQPVAGGPPKQLTDFKANQIHRFEWSPDGKQLLCARGVFTQDVVQISGFR